jgi:hypothetical protein
LQAAAAPPGAVGAPLTRAAPVPVPRAHSRPLAPTAGETAEELPIAHPLDEIAEVEVPRASSLLETTPVSHRAEACDRRRGGDNLACPRQPTRFTAMGLREQSRLAHRARKRQRLTRPPS